MADQQASGVVSGTVTDQAGDLAIGARVALASNGQNAACVLTTGDNGEFSFKNVPFGPFLLTVSAPGFDIQKYSGQLEPGQVLFVPEIKLSVSRTVTEVRVGATPEEAAEIEVHQELQQRLLGIFPNFYVTYTPDPAPLLAKQKFYLAWRSVIDPVNIGGVAFVAGLSQAADQFGAYGQGAAGYARRFGAGYGDDVFATFISSAILPTVFHQDPRYLYQGTGSTRSRLAHALENSVVTRDDHSKKRVPNYSAIIGSFVSGAISYLYYPPSDRGASLYLQNSLVALGANSLAGVCQEFVLRKFTSHAPKPAAAGSQP
jgi:Carboxypeptidase regulatory-like domain